MIFQFVHEDEDPLDHRSRKMIFNYISTHPGEPFQRIKKVLDINSSTLRYHLRYLEKAGKIEVEMRKGKNCFFPCGHEEFSKGSDTSDLTLYQQRVLEAIKRKPGISKKGLTNYINLDKREVSKCIDELRDRKLIWKVLCGRKTGYEYITKEKLKEEMLRLLIDRFLNREINKEKFLALKSELEKD